MLQIFDTTGRLVAVPVNADYTAGTYTVDYSGQSLPAGVYYVRMQNGVTQQVKTMIKAPH